MARVPFCATVVVVLVGVFGMGCKKNEASDTDGGVLVIAQPITTPSTTNAVPPPPPPPLNTCEANGRTKCFDAKFALFCQAGRYQILPCKGPLGCRVGTPDALCDDNIAADGDPCKVDPAGGESNHACTTDRKEEVACIGGTFHTWRGCRGPRGCAVSAGKPDCDNSVAEAGEPCTEGETACRPEKDALLECRGGKFVATSSCRGPRGCSVPGAPGAKAACDDSVANVGDVCEPADEVRCSVDKKSELRCVGGRYMKKKDCAKKPCAASGKPNEVVCE